MPDFREPARPPVELVASSLGSRVTRGAARRDPSLRCLPGVPSLLNQVLVRGAHARSARRPAMSEPMKPQHQSSLRCKLGIHGYVKFTNDEGGRYLVCSRCGKESFPPDSAGPRIVA